MEILNLSLKKIKTIDANVFEGLSNLRKLDLNENQLRKIKANTFKCLSQLEILDLFSNKMTHSIEKTGFVSKQNRKTRSENI